MAESGGNWWDEPDEPHAPVLEDPRRESSQLPEWRAWSSWRKPPWFTWVTIIVLVILSVPAYVVGDWPALLILLGGTALLTGGYALLRNRMSWALLGSRVLRAVVAVMGLISLLAGSLLLAAMGNPRDVDGPIQADPPAVVEPVQTAGPVASEGPEPSAAPEPTSTPKPAGSSAPLATELLASLKVKGKAAGTGYDREGQFGQAWLDVDSNGCDTRNDILGRDLTATTVDDDECTVRSGTFPDPYTGQSFDFVRGPDSVLVQIDHVVPLYNAWLTGAQQLSSRQRVAFANDPLNLLASNGTQNQKKGAGDAATWLPPNKSFRCAYVARQVSVKAEYGLWVTRAERDAISRVLSSCPDQRAITEAESAP